MIDLHNVPPARASVIIQAGGPLLTPEGGGATYCGPCPAAQTHNEDGVHNADIGCGVCSTEFTARIERPPEGAPNVVVVLIDDIGFGSGGSFGGSIPVDEATGVASFKIV